MYREIIKFKNKLINLGVPCEMRDAFDGFEVWFKDKQNNTVRVSEHIESAGSEEDKLELRGLLTDEEKEHTSFVGYMTADEIIERVKKDNG